MSFLKLSNIIINTSKIIWIRKKPSNAYKILLSWRDISGSMFMSSGDLKTEYYHIDVSESDDIKALETFIERNKV
jgi:hypothetical protein